VVTTFLLIDFILMAASAVLRRDNHSNCCAVVLKGIGICFFRAMAVVTADAGFSVRAAAPFLSQGRINGAMALETGLILLCKLATSRGFA
jgi:hypothetical protein